MLDQALLYLDACGRSIVHGDGNEEDRRELEINCLRAESRLQAFVVMHDLNDFTQLMRWAKREGIPLILVDNVAWMIGQQELSLF